MESDTSSEQTPQPGRKRSRVKPNGYLPPGFEPTYWCLWKYEWQFIEETGRWESRKPTHSPRILRKFRWKEKDDSWQLRLEQDLWGTFEETFEVYRRFAERFDGIGYVLEPHLPLLGDEWLYPVVTDLDGCRGPESGTIDPWARKIVDEQGTFAELSPSGEGLHLIGHGWKRPRSEMVFEIDGHRVENYGGDVGGRRFMTYTGATP